MLVSLLACGHVARGQGQTVYEPRPIPACTTPANMPSCTSPVPGGGYQPCCRPDCPHCQPPSCQPPCDSVPRKGQPRRGQPRDAVGPPTGNYVAPPPSGTVEGPQRGVELGGMAITFPELTIGLPKLRFTHCSQFVRNGRMHLDSGVAPYVENPYAAYQAAVTQRSAEEEDDTTRRNAEENEEDQTTKRTARPPCAEPARTATDQATCDRLDRLEECIRQQNEAILRCIQQIKQSPGGAISPAPPIPMPPAEEVPSPAPQKMGKLYPHWPNPHDPAPALIRPAGYLQPIPAAPLTERLPPITEES